MQEQTGANKPLPSDSLVMAPAKLSAASKSLGVAWFVVVYLFTTEELYTCCALGLVGVVWGIWEIYWSRRWRLQEAQAAEILQK